MKRTYLRPAVHTLRLAPCAHMLTTSDYSVNNYRSGSRQTVGDRDEE